MVSKPTRPQSPTTPQGEVETGECLWLTWLLVMLDNCSDIPSIWHTPAQCPSRRGPRKCGFSRSTKCGVKSGEKDDRGRGEGEGERRSRPKTGPSASGFVESASAALPFPCPSPSAPPWPPSLLPLPSPPRPRPLCFVDALRPPPPRSTCPPPSSPPHLLFAAAHSRTLHPSALLRRVELLHALYSASVHLPLAISSRLFTPTSLTSTMLISCPAPASPTPSPPHSPLRLPHPRPLLPQRPPPPPPLPHEPHTGRRRRRLPVSPAPPRPSSLPSPPPGTASGHVGGASCGGGGSGGSGVMGSPRGVGWPPSQLSSVGRLTARPCPTIMDEDKLKKYKTTMVPSRSHHSTHLSHSPHSSSTAGCIDFTSLPSSLSAAPPLCPVQCQRLLSAEGCKFGVHCDFAHGEEELRRSLNAVAYAPVICQIKGCVDKLCKYAHNMAESQYHPDVSIITPLHASCACPPLLRSTELASSPAPGMAALQRCRCTRQRSAPTGTRTEAAQSAPLTPLLLSSSTSADCR